MIFKSPSESEMIQWDFILLRVAYCHGSHIDYFAYCTGMVHYMSALVEPHKDWANSLCGTHPSHKLICSVTRI